MQMTNHVDVKRTGKLYLDEKGVTHVEQMNKKKSSVIAQTSGCSSYWSPSTFWLRQINSFYLSWFFLLDQYKPYRCLNVIYTKLPDPLGTRVEKGICELQPKEVIGPRSKKSHKYISEKCSRNLRRIESVQEQSAKLVRIR